ncbi:MAG: 30S ribosomal protein S2 [Candidatus Njordarchaeales archaeon]
MSERRRGISIAEEFEEVTTKEEMLIPLKTYIRYGAHIGTNKKTKDMERFIFKRKGGVYLINIVKTDERIRLAARLLAKYQPNEVAIFGSRLYAQKPIIKMGEWTKFIVFPGRYLPGTLTNPQLVTYVEPEIILVSDPIKERQAIQEAFMIGVPVIALCDTNNTLSNIDLAIPANNKGRKSLALIFWLLTNQILRERGELSEGETIKETPEDFMIMLS